MTAEPDMDPRLRCSHCDRRLRGSASITSGSKRLRLCHPEFGMDCYRLVTVYDHQPVRCPCAVDVRVPVGLAAAVLDLLLQADRTAAFGKCVDHMSDETTPPSCMICTTLEQFGGAVEGRPVDWPYGARLSFDDAAGETQTEQSES